jgi:hypothetical protein
VGGGGGDVFLFSGKTGLDVIRDFSVTNAKIGISSSRVDDFSDLNIRSDTNGNAVVDLDAETGAGADYVTLIGVSARSLSSEDVFCDF